MSYKTFRYTLSNPYISNTFNIDVNKCNSLFDIKSEIASILRIESYQIDIINPPEIKHISDYYDFSIKINYLDKNDRFQFQFLDGKRIEIEDSYKMKFVDVFQHFRKIDVYFSELCIQNNVEMSQKGKLLSHDGYPFLATSCLSNIDVRLTGNFVILAYGKKEFLFSEKDDIYSAQKLIFEAFPEIKYSSLISIRNEKTNEEIQSNDNFCSTEKYKIVINYKFTFENIFEKYDEKTIKMDFLTSVSDAEQILVNTLANANKHQPDDIYIYFYDKNSQKISKTNKLLLKEIKNFQGRIYYSMHFYVRRFQYQISDPRISDYFEVDIREYNNIYYLKNIIASKINLNPSQIQITNSFKNLEEIPANFTFNLEITCNKNINFIFQNGRKIEIKGSYKMKFNDIFKYFANEGYYFSKSCIKNKLNIYNQGKKLSFEGYPFFGINYNSSVEVRLIGNFIAIEYGQKSFTFSENDFADEAFEFIYESFNKKVPKDLIIILIEDKNEKIPNHYRFKSDEKYRVEIKHQFNFRNKSIYDDKLSPKLDYFSTVSDAQKILSNIFGDNCYIRPEDIIIYEYSLPVSNKQTLLCDIGSCIYFDIKENRFSSYREEKKYKYFYYHTKDLLIYKQFKIDPNKCKVLKDIIDEIASKLKIDFSQISILNRPYSKDVNYINEYYDFEIEINCCRDAIFKFDDGKQIEIKNSYKMNINQVFEYIKREGVYYSNSCIFNNIKLFNNEKEIPKDGYPFLRVFNNNNIEIQLSRDSIKIEFTQKKFIFSEKDDVYWARELILKVFPEAKSSSNILIHKKGITKELNVSYYLKKDEEYDITIEFTFYFRTYSSGYNYYFSNQRMDYYSTISDGQQRMSLVLGVNPECIVIYDQYKNEVTDLNMYLRDIQNSGSNVYFVIDNERKQTKSSHHKKRIQEIQPKDTKEKEESKPKLSLKEEENGKIQRRRIRKRHNTISERARKNSQNQFYIR